MADGKFIVILFVFVYRAAVADGGKQQVVVSNHGHIFARQRDKRL